VGTTAPLFSWWCSSSPSTASGAWASETVQPLANTLHFAAGPDHEGTASSDASTQSDNTTERAARPCRAVPPICSVGLPDQRWEPGATTLGDRGGSRPEEVISRRLPMGRETGLPPGCRPRWPRPEPHPRPSSNRERAWAVRPTPGRGDLDAWRRPSGPSLSYRCRSRPRNGTNRARYARRMSAPFPSA
jgi:hypothetical protein